MKDLHIIIYRLRLVRFLGRPPSPQQDRNADKKACSFAGSTASGAKAFPLPTQYDIRPTAWPRLVYRQDGRDSPTQWIPLIDRFLGHVPDLQIEYQAQTGLNVLDSRDPVTKNRKPPKKHLPPDHGVPVAHGSIRTKNRPVGPEQQIFLPLPLREDSILLQE